MLPLLSEQLEVVLTGRQGPGAGLSSSLWSHHRGKERELSFSAAMSISFLLSVLAFLFPFCFKYKIPSGDSDYKPSA